MAMTTQLINTGNNTLRTEWTAGLCSTLTYTTVKLFKNSTEIATTNTSGLTHNWPGQYTAGDYYSTVQGFTGSPGTECDTGTSSTITLSSFCLPVSPTNVSFSKLGLFYGITGTNIALSGPNNPSTGTSIFGTSELPNTGAVSKTIPNAVSELFNTCGGVQTWDSWPFKLDSTINSSSTACQLGIDATTTYYINSQTLTSATSLWSNSNLTTKVTTAGYYSNGVHWIQINTSGNVISSGTC